MKYICYYDHRQGAHQKRTNHPAAATKLSYIAGCLAKIEPTEIVSASGVTGRETAPAEKERLGENLTIRYFFSLGRKNALCGKLGTALVQWQVFLYLLTRIAKEETILVYHSLGYMRWIQMAKKIKKFKLILEVEEIYGDVIGSPKARKQELAFFQWADGFVFPTNMLSAIINRDEKPEVIIHGTYQVEPDRKCKVFGKEDGTIHCVYAGTLDPRKGSVTAAAATEFLPEHYHIHILGFGSAQEIQNMKDTVAAVSSRSKAKVSYDGILSGEDYIRFLQSCDIGLSPQDVDAVFNATSFPSKILSYMANGLQVVSIRIPAIEQSAVGQALYYYDRQTPEEIAKAILSVNLRENLEPRQRIAALADQFERKIQELLNGV